MAETEPAAIAGGTKLRLARRGGALFCVLVGWSFLALSPCSPAPNPTIDQPMVSPKVSAELAELDRAEALRKQGKINEALSVATPLLTHGEKSVRATALGITSRIAMKQGRSEEAVVGLKEAARWHAEALEFDASMRDELVLAHLSTYQTRRFEDARSALERATKVASQTREGQAAVHYFEGLLAFECGDLRLALFQFRAAVSDSEKQGISTYRAAALPWLAFVMQLLGREAEGETLLNGALAAAENVDTCLRADVWANVAWFHIQTSTPGARAEELIRTALALRNGPCADRNALAHVLTDYAVLRLRQGNIADARAKLNEARAASDIPDGGLVLAWLDTEGRLALRENKPKEALSYYTTLENMSQAAAFVTSQRSAALGKARALEALGRDKDAGSAYERAEALLAAGSQLVPANEGRIGYLQSFGEGTTAAISFFHKHNPSMAAKVARRANARALASLHWTDRIAALGPDERARWERDVARYRTGRAQIEAAVGEYWKLTDSELAATIQSQKEAQAELTRKLDVAIASLYAGSTPFMVEPSSPAKDETILVYYPSEEGWMGFALTPNDVRAKLLIKFDIAASKEALSQTFLMPFRKEIEASKRVRFILHPSLYHIDFHTLPWAAGPLIASVSVVYGADIGAPQNVAPKVAIAQTVPKALLVADPQSDLRSTRDEVKRAELDLSKAGFETQLLIGEEATFSTFRRFIETAPLELLHYAGHGAYGGTEGWQSHLKLAQGSELSVGDIIALRNVPPFVVLSGCETGQTVSQQGTGGLGLGHAFLVAGAKVVVASVKPIADNATAQLAGRLYTGLEKKELDVQDLSENLRKLVLSQPSGSTEAESFRILVP